MSTTPSQSASLKVANAPCSWGVLEFELAGEAAGYAQVLDEIRDTGYVGTELGDWGFMPTDPKALKQDLANRNLELVGAFVPVAFVNESSHAEGEERALMTARLMQQAAGPSPFIILADDNGKVPARTQNAGRIRAEQGLTQDQWIVYGKGVNRVAETILRETGLRTVFHHHCAGYVETPEEIDAFLRHTDPEKVGLCFDTGHYRFGGGDPEEGFRKFRNRAWHVHFKDCSASVRDSAAKQSWDYFQALQQGIFCELGKGDVPFRGILDQLRNSAYSGWIVVEQDVLPGMGSPKECARRNRAFLRSCNL